jgi:hypothetical protein
MLEGWGAALRVWLARIREEDSGGRYSRSWGRGRDLGAVWAICARWTFRPANVCETEWRPRGTVGHRQSEDTNDGVSRWTPARSSAARPRRVGEDPEERTFDINAHWAFSERDQ